MGFFEYILLYYSPFLTSRGVYSQRQYSQATVIGQSVWDGRLLINSSLKPQKERWRPRLQPKQHAALVAVSRSLFLSPSLCFSLFLALSFLFFLSLSSSFLSQLSSLHLPSSLLIPFSFFLFLFSGFRFLKCCVVGVLDVWGSFNGRSERPNAYLIPLSPTGSGWVV